MKFFEFFTSFIGVAIYLVVGMIMFSFSTLLFSSVSSNGGAGIFIMFFGLAFFAVSLSLIITALTVINKVFINLSTSGRLFDYQGLFYKMERILKKTSEVLIKIYYGAFLSFWFTGIITGAFLSIKDGNYVSLIFLIPFIIVGVFLIIKLFVKK